MPWGTPASASPRYLIQGEFFVKMEFSQFVGIYRLPSLLQLDLLFRPLRLPLLPLLPSSPVPLPLPPLPPPSSSTCSPPSRSSHPRVLKRPVRSHHPPLPEADGDPPALERRPVAPPEVQSLPVRRPVLPDVALVAVAVVPVGGAPAAAEARIPRANIAVAVKPSLGALHEWVSP